MSEPVLTLRISAGYPGHPDVLKEMALEVGEGEIVGLVGPSGEGKSTIAKAILGLLPFQGGSCRGEIFFEGRNLLALSGRQMREVRGKRIALVPQSPIESLNPNLRLGSQLEEAWRAHEPGRPDWQPLLESAQLPGEPGFLRQYPSSLSVGQAQRFLIAMAMLHSPALLVADEATSALDSITQAAILALFRRLNRERGISILFISHDLPAVAGLCHRVAILRRGRVVECAPVERVFRDPQDPYTRSLIEAIPKVSFESESDRLLLRH